MHWQMNENNTWRSPETNPSCRLLDCHSRALQKVREHWLRFTASECWVYHDGETVVERFILWYPSREERGNIEGVRMRNLTPVSHQCSLVFTTLQLPSMLWVCEGANSLVRSEFLWSPLLWKCPHRGALCQSTHFFSQEIMKTNNHLSWPC